MSSDVRMLLTNNRNKLIPFKPEGCSCNGKCGGKCGDKCSGNCKHTAGNVEKQVKHLG
jgi:hypothetical protein